jgi:hypothetical protein
MLRYAPDVLRKWRVATTAPKHMHHDGDIVTIKPERGNSLAYTLDRLYQNKALAGGPRLIEMACSHPSRLPSTFLKAWRRWISGIVIDRFHTPKTDVAIGGLVKEFGALVADRLRITLAKLATAQATSD